MSNTPIVTESDFEAEVLQSEQPVLVDFYADWCGPCRALAPLIDEIAEESSDAKVVKVNVDENPQLASQFSVMSIPTLIVFRDGEVAQRHQGLADKKQIGRLLAG